MDFFRRGVCVVKHLKFTNKHKALVEILGLFCLWLIKWCHGVIGLTYLPVTQERRVRFPVAPPMLPELVWS